MSKLCRLVRILGREGDDLVVFVQIDEAGQATEPESMLVAALMGQPRQLILAGDPMQLGPVIQGRTSNLGGLGVSLLARLLRCGPYIRWACQGYLKSKIFYVVLNKQTD